MGCRYGGHCLWLFGVLCLTVCLGVTGCRKQADTIAPETKPSAPKTSTAWIKATPNPVPIPGGSDKGTTTLSWDTGDGSNAQVYLRVAGKPDQLFSGGPRNKAEAKWIKKNRQYEFILFAGNEHATELARVTVAAE